MESLGCETLDESTGSAKLGGAKTLDASTLAPGESLDGRDLSGWTLMGDFSGRSFVGADLSGATLDGCVLRRAILRIANLRGASLVGVDASRADCRGACLSGARADGLRLRRAVCREATMLGLGMQSGTIARLSLPPKLVTVLAYTTTPLAVDKWAADESLAVVDAAKEAEEDEEDEARTRAHKDWFDSVTAKNGVSGTTAYESLLDLQGMDIRAGNMQLVHAPFANMRGMMPGHLGAHQNGGTTIPGAMMHGMHAFGADLHGADFNRCGIGCMTDDLLKQGLSDLSDAELQMLKAGVKTQLRASNLRGVNFEHSGMEKAFLVDTETRGASFEGCDLRKSMWNGARLEGASFRNTNMSGAIMTGAKFGTYKMPPKPKAPPRGQAAKQLVAVMGRGLVSAAIESGDSTDDDDDGGDEYGSDDDPAQASSLQELAATMVTRHLERTASVIARSVPRVVAACDEARIALKKATDQTNTALEAAGELEAALDAVAINKDREAAAAMVEALMRQALRQLLDRFVEQLQTQLHQAGTALVLDDTSTPKRDAHDITPKLVARGSLSKLGAQKSTHGLGDEHDHDCLGVPGLLELLWRAINKRVEPLLEQTAIVVAKDIDGSLAPRGLRRSGTMFSRSCSSARVADQSATVPLLESPASVYRKALQRMLDTVAATLDDPSAVAKQWLLREGGRRLQAGGCRLRSLDTQVAALQKQLMSKLTTEDAKIVGADTTFSKLLETHVRSHIAQRALARGSQYPSSGWRGMLYLVWVTDPLVLISHENELVTLKEMLAKLQEAQVTSELWQDVYESWASMLALRSKLVCHVAQQVFDAIATDVRLLEGLAGAELLKDITVASGQVPNELLLKLKQGPGKHVKNCAYRYRRKIDTEITRIGRIRELKQRGVALSISALVSGMIAVGTFIARLVYETMFPPDPVVVVVPPS